MPRVAQDRGTARSRSPQRRNAGSQTGDRRTRGPAIDVVRRFRLPIAARVVIERGGPVRVVPATSAMPPGGIVNRAGPWRTSGRWWTTDRTNWDRDEWDVELAGGGCYRLRENSGAESGKWERSRAKSIENFGLWTDDGLENGPGHWTRDIGGRDAEDIV